MATKQSPKVKRFVDHAIITVLAESNAESSFDL